VLSVSDVQFRKERKIMSEPFIAEIKMFAGNFAPRGYAFCDGQILPIDQNSALFSLVGTIYGGDGRTTFGLPDLRGRSPMHPGQGPGLSHRRLGQKGGAENVTLTVAQMPAHQHAIQGKVKGSTSSLDTNTPQDKVLGTGGRGTNVYGSGDPDVDMAAGTVDATAEDAGGSQAHANTSPFLCVSFIIALVGIFPSRG
jgi:microcystin-dependent protein